MGKWTSAPGTAVLHGLGVALLLVSLGMMVVALFGGRKAGASWDRWTRRVLYAGGGAFLVFHLEGVRRWMLWPPGGMTRVLPWEDGRILEASWLGWASLAAAFAAVLLLHLARAGRVDRALWTWFGALLPLGVVAVVCREVALTFLPIPGSIPDAFVFPYHEPSPWRDLLFPVTGWVLVPASLPVFVGILARLPSMASRFPKLPPPTAPALQAGTLLTFSLVVVHVERLVWEAYNWSDPDFLLGVDPPGAGAVLLGAAALVLLALGWEGWERTLGMRGTAPAGAGPGAAGESR